MRNFTKKSIFIFSLLSLSFLSYAQNTPIINANLKGIVVDKDNQEPLTGVTVSIKGTTNGAVTDINGEFNLNTGQVLPFTLIVRSIGYKPLEYLATTKDVKIELSSDEASLQEVVVTSRRRAELVQEVPIPITTIRGVAIEDAGAFNVNRLKELVPTVQLYASNPRNTTLNIRGLGSTFGLTNDGIDPGVGFYLDGVYLARPAATALDFIDIEQVEVLRGPQGTLFGKNTTSGAFNITSRLPEFRPGATFEVSYGNYGYVQAKTSITGALSKTLAARVSFSGTQRDGTLFNVSTNRTINDINNLGIRGQLLFTPTDKIKLVLAADATSQKPDGYGWGIAGVVTTQRSEHRQFNNIIKDLGYTIPYKSAFERKVDLDTQSKADNALGGVSLNADFKIGNGTLTSTSAYRYWDWVPLNDRDYTGLPAYTISAGNSVHGQWSQEFRYSGKINDKVSGVVGLFGLWQDLKTDPVHTEEAGDALWRFQQNSASATQWGPGLIDKVGIRTKYNINSTSLAAFSQIDWAITPKLHILPGIRYNYDKKVANYDRKKYIENSIAYTPAQLAAVNSIYSDQTFDINADAGNFSGQLSAQYKFNKKINAYATYSISYKPIGINVGGLPTANGQVLTNLAEVRPEAVDHKEFGFKSNPNKNTILNLTFYQTDIKDYQTQVQTPEPGVNRGYLANAEKVRVKGFELDGSIKLGSHLRLNAAFAYTDGKYVKFSNAPVPLEEVGGEAFKDISGGRLPGISKYSGSIGAEATKKGSLIGLTGNYFAGVDYFYRSEFSSSPSPSQYLNIDGYGLLNARVGFRASNGISILVWSRNLGNVNYYEQLLAAPGSSGQYAGIIGDPRTYGVTLRYTL
jgi:iron complex outermembrane receptor protein